MKSSIFLIMWPVTMVLIHIILLVALLLGSSPAQAVSGEQGDALQATISPATAPAGIPVEPIGLIPVTGAEVVNVNFFSSWMFWSGLVLLVTALLVALFMRPRAQDKHSHDM